ncbi:spermidine synthase [Halobacteriales archaeon QS_8_69_26]|nr:MAG: spermidine synthase [Halobacteriales archaeon QS_8_69_26]
MNVRSRRAVVFALTFVVAFCSIVYELIYSELLTVVFGGTVVRYSVTIGLFLFSLGVGAFLFRYLEDAPTNFLRVEILLAVAGPLGLVYIVALNSLPGAEGALPRNLALPLSHLPIVVVGLLSGLEVPFLTTMIDEREDSLLSSVGVSPGRVLRRGLSLVFVTEDPARTDGGGNADPGADGEESDLDGFSEILGMDYVGSLAGTVVWALVLFPSLGLISSVFVLGLLNGLAAVAFWWEFPAGSKALLLAALLVSGAYAGVLAEGGTVESELTELYFENRIEGEYVSGNMEVDLDRRFTTRYQTVSVYERRWTGPARYHNGPEGPETCLRLDLQVQLCESWIEAYHGGLVDVPASFYEDMEDKRVLVVGGGDFVAVDHLREYNVTVDQVDIDREFMAYARNSSLLARYHDDAHEYDRLNTVVADAFTYLGETNRTYDLVLLDLPGIRNDDLLHLYSVEFYERIDDHLAEDGLVVTWAYSRYFESTHNKVYMNTVHEAGFTRYARYEAMDDFDRDGDVERGEIFYVLSRGHTPELDAANASSEYVRRHREAYGNVTWRPVPTYRGVRANRVFHPNYDIIVEFPR